ncbi:MAG: NRDE family protein [Reichenbachiella sp.]|uniref:NRDE family protein n=1 Tax=Reichenbachiella sp. TaxID=2184521 RepID=UPI003299B55D
MCLILFAWKKHTSYDLIVTANRDEFYNRPTESACTWSEYPDLIAGKDLTAGGTWMGITKTGKFAALTNYRDIANINNDAPTRGDLTKNYLTQDTDPQTYLEEIKSAQIPYNGFNLLVGDNHSLWYYNNINHQIKSLEPGVYGLSNALLNDPWPKVVTGKQQLTQLIQDDHVTSESLLSIIQNKAIAPDDQLPSTGVPLDWERALSAMYITMENYGTRCSTTLLKKNKNSTFTEKTYPHLGQKEDQVEFIF